MNKKLQDMFGIREMGPPQEMNEYQKSFLDLLQKSINAHTGPIRREEILVMLASTVGSLAAYVEQHQTPGLEDVDLSRSVEESMQLGYLGAGGKKDSL